MKFNNHYHWIVTIEMHLIKKYIREITDAGFGQIGRGVKRTKK